MGHYDNYVYRVWYSRKDSNWKVWFNGQPIVARGESRLNKDYMEYDTKSKAVDKATSLAKRNANLGNKVEVQIETKGGTVSDVRRYD